MSVIKTKNKTINVSDYTFQAITYTAKVLGLSKKALINTLFNSIIQETALLKINSGNLEIAHDSGVVTLKFSGRPYCQFGTISLPTNLTDKEIDKAILKKVYGEDVKID